jgi:hypothetical protein
MANTKNSGFSWDNITVGPHQYSQYRILTQFLKTKHRRFYIASHPEFGNNIVIKQYPQEKLLDIVSAIRYLYIFNGMKHSIHVYDMWSNNIAMERLDGILGEFEEEANRNEADRNEANRNEANRNEANRNENTTKLTRDEKIDIDKNAFDCFCQLLYAIREFHLYKVALFNISPKTIGWVNKNGQRIYKFFDYTKAKSFRMVKRDPIEDVIALGRMFERYENLYIQAIAKDCVSGQFTADQIYQHLCGAK